MQDPAVWNDPKRAEVLGREASGLETVVEGVEKIERSLRDASDLLDLAEEENDESTVDEVLRDLKRVSAEVEQFEFQRMFSGKLDNANAFLDIQSGAGGTEAQDWAAMLLRMYLKYCETMGFSTEIIDSSDGEVAGIKGATIHVTGPYAYGWLRTETGVHRLVRKSPFDSGNRRHTSFAAVFVSPEIDEDIDIEIDPSDLRVDVYRASGAGGQHVNKTESAVRMTHIPTNTVVQCQSERSQHKNRATAMKMLRGLLYERMLAEKNKAFADSYESGKSAIDFGSQIRTYTMQPYQLVKDERTEHKVSNVEAVLDGNLDPFIEAYLLSISKGEEETSG